MYASYHAAGSTAQAAARSWRSALDLAGLVAGLTAGAALLHATAGPPHLPDAVPAAADVLRFLRGSDVPWDAVGYATSTAAWLLLAWMAGTLALRVVVALAETVARGAAWARGLRALSDRVTLPLVRRVVDRALVAGMVVTLAGRAAPAAAEALPPVAASVALAAQPAGHSDVAARPPAVHVVAPGDNLWRLAERYYGSGEAHERIAAANTGRVMADGARFADPGLIRPGWALEIPGHHEDVEEIDGARVYTVRPGDTLAGIARLHLGTAERWRELFELNRGAATTPEGLVLTHPDRIWPGLPLVLPDRPRSAEIPHPGTHASVPAETVPPAPITEALAAPAEEPSATAATGGPGDAADVGRPRVWRQPPAPPPVMPAHSGDAQPRPSSNGGRAVPPTLSAAVAAVAGAAVLGAAVRQRIRRSSQEPPVPDDAIALEALGTQDSVHLDAAVASRRGGMEPDPAVAIACHVERLLDAAGDAAASTVWATVRRNARGIAADLLLRSDFHDPARLEAASREVERRLGCRAVARPAGGGDVALSLTRLRPASLVVLSATARPAGESQDAAPTLLPIGMAPGVGVVSIDWRALGHVLVAGGRAEARWGVVAHVLASLASRAPTGTLEVWVASDDAERTAPMLGLPQVRHVGAAELLPGAVSELRRRMAGGTAAGGELVLAAVDLPTMLGDESSLDALEAIGAHGAAHGLRLVGAAPDTSRLSEAQHLFSSRIVFQTADEEESVRLLGTPDAVDLGAPPDALVQVGGRPAVRLRSLAASAEDLHRVGAAIRSSVRLDPLVGGKVAPAATNEEHLAGLETQLTPHIPPDPSAGDDRSAFMPGSQARAEDPAAWELAPLQESCGASGPATVPDPHQWPTETGEVARTGALATAALAEPTALYGSAPRALDGAVVAPALGEIPGNGEPRGPGASSHGSDAPDSPCEADADADPGDSSPTEQPRIVEVRCFGDLEIIAGGQPVGADGGLAAQKRPREALAFLASHPTSGVTREKLLAALWPDASSHQGARRLTVVLTRIREIVGIPASALRCDRDGVVRLDCDVVRSDVHEFLALLKAAKGAPPGEAKALYARALDLYRGDLLLSPECNWLDNRDDGATLREHYREQWRRAAQELARLHVEAGDPASAAEVYRRLLAVEPTAEDHVRALYRCYEAMGDRTALVMEDRRLRRALREALADPEDPDDDPDLYPPHPETVALFEAIMERLLCANPIDQKGRDKATSVAA